MKFSDEKRFMVWNDGPVRVWRRSDERFAGGKTNRTVKNKKGIMVWLGISSDGSSRLVRCPDRMDSAQYQSCVLTPCLNFIRHPNPARRDSVVFMQDGASCHTSRSTLDFLRMHHVNLLTPWPAMSPDLNPVEHCWSWLAARLVGKSFPTTNALWEAIQFEWSRKPPSLIPSLYGSMVRRLTAVQCARGGNTGY